MLDVSNSDVMGRGGGGNTKTQSLRGPADVRQWISCMRDRRVLNSVGGDHAAFRLAHASQLSSALQMTLRHGPKSVRMNSASFDTCQAPTSPHKSESQHSQLTAHGDERLHRSTKTMNAILR